MDVVISNSVKTKTITSVRIKNDKLDSHMMAQFPRADLVSTVHVNSQQTRQNELSPKQVAGYHVDFTAFRR